MKIKQKAIILLSVMALSVTSMISVSAYHSEITDYAAPIIRQGQSHAFGFTSNFAEAELFTDLSGSSVSYGTGKFSGTKGGLVPDTVKTESIGKSNATQVAAIATAYTDMSTEQVGKTSVTATQNGPLWKSATPTGHACTTIKDSNNHWLTAGVKW